MEGKKLVLFLAIVFLLIPFISSAPPVTTVSQFPDGYLIIEAQQPTLKINENHTYYFFLYNASNGIRIDNSTVNCSFYLANDEGDLLIEGEPAYQPNGYWYREIDGELYLNETGFYSYGVNCQNDFGGALAGNLIVTTNGEELTIPITHSYIGLLAILVFLFLVNMGAIGFLDGGRFKPDPNGKIIDRGALAYVKPILFVVAWVVLMAIFFVSSNYALAYLNFELFGQLFFTIYKVMFYLTLPLFVVWIIWIFVSIFQDNEMKRILERGGDDFGDI